VARRTIDEIVRPVEPGPDVELMLNLGPQREQNRAPRFNVLPLCSELDIRVSSGLYSIRGSQMRTKGLWMTSVPIFGTGVLQVRADEQKEAFDPVGRCIYCPTSEGVFTKEHIVPEGIGGKMVLPKASCAACQKITSALEQKLLRGSNWRPNRARLQIKGKKKKKREPPAPTEFPATLESEGESQKIHIKAADYPSMLFFVFDPPGIVSGKTLDGLPAGKAMLMRNPARKPIASLSPSEILDPFKRERLTLDVNFDAADLVRLLAKIALGYAIGKRGFNAFERFYVQDIVKGNVDGAMTFVGGASSEILDLWLPGSGLHRVMDRVLGDEVSVYVQLFCEPGEPPPIYEVVVGKLRATTPNSAPSGTRLR
jgi:hypothetical protein